MTKLRQAQAGPLMEFASLSDTVSVGDDHIDDNAVKDSLKKISEYSDSSSDDDDDLQVGDSSSKRQKKDLENITSYIDIISPARTQQMKETTITHGPFFFALGTSHHEFLQLLAACAVEKNFIPAVSSVNQNQLFWKLLVPANDKKKPHYNEQGYQALITKLKALSEKGKELSVTLLMPPMLKTRQGVRISLSSYFCQCTHSTQEDSDHRHFQDAFEDEELRNGPMGSTIREQKVRHSIQHLFSRLMVVWHFRLLLGLVMLCLWRKFVKSIQLQ
jgi:hypothetical protein